MSKICFTSLGCPRNLIDSEVMIGILLKEGYEITYKIEEANYCIVNTCGFLSDARKEAIRTIKDIFENKKKSSKVIVTGCMTELFHDQLVSLFPDIFYFLGPGNIEDILFSLKTKEKGKLISKKSFLEKEDTPRFLSTPKNYAYLKIAEGCCKRCSYCLIPFIKGPLKSKTIEQIKNEVISLIEKDVKEVILIAQDLGDWGKDLYKDKRLSDLLKELLSIDKDFKLRLMYLYPDSITDELIDIIASDERIYKYIDMPIQHINDEILKKMRRSTTRSEIIKIIEKLRKKIPNIVLRTTLMVGFPSETEAQFEELVDFLRKYELERVGIFRYSNEKKVLASSFKEQVSAKVKVKREKVLYEIQREIMEKRNRQMIGKKMDVVIEGFHPESKLLLVGRMWDMAPEIDPQVIINDYELFNGFNKTYSLQITDVIGVDLIGKIIIS